MDKKSLSERDICSKYIAPAIVKAGWDMQRQVLEEFGFTAGRIVVRGKLHSRGARKRADYLLSYQKNLPIALIEAKDNTHSIGSGMQQALGYAETLDIPFVFSSNGDGFLFHDRTLAPANRPKPNSASTSSPARMNSGSATVSGRGWTAKHAARSQRPITTTAQAAYRATTR